MNVRRLVAATALAALTTSCGLGAEPDSCTVVGFESRMEVDIAALDRPEPVEVRVCVDDECRTVEPTMADRPATLWVPVGEGGSTERTIEITDGFGELLAGPSSVRFDVVRPNGDGCGPDARFVEARAESDGRIVRVDR